MIPLLEYDLEVLHCWKRIIKMMQQIFPVLVLAGLAKSYRVVLDPVPLH
jgi:hypothetical protein